MAVKMQRAGVLIGGLPVPLGTGPAGSKTADVDFHTCLLQASQLLTRLLRVNSLRKDQCGEQAETVEHWNAPS